MNAVETVVANLVASWQAEGSKRQERSPSDTAADTLVACARELQQAVATASELDEEIGPQEYGDLHNRSASQVRRWCQADRLKHRRVGRDYLIRRGEKPPIDVAQDSAA